MWEPPTKSVRRPLANQYERWALARATIPYKCQNRARTRGSWLSRSTSLTNGDHTPEGASKINIGRYDNLAHSWATRVPHETSLRRLRRQTQGSGRYLLTLGKRLAKRQTLRSKKARRSLRLLGLCEGKGATSRDFIRYAHSSAGSEGPWIGFRKLSVRNPLCRDLIRGLPGPLH